MVIRSRDEMFDADRALATVRRLDFPRSCGSPEEAKAQEIIARELQALGLDVAYERFEDWWIEPEHASLNGLGQTLEVEPAVPLTFLAAFPWLGGRGVEVEISGLVARPDPLDAQCGMSPIAVRDAFDPSTPAFPGAVAQLLLFPPTTEFIPYALTADPFVPSAYVPERHIPRVLAHLGHLATLRWKPRRVVRAFSNVVAEIRGKRLPHELIVLGAHLDSFPGTVGASDNAAGCAVLLEVARWFRNHPPDRTVKFAWFTGEELDRRGSKHFVKQLCSGHERICLFIGSDGGFEIETGPPWVHVSEQRVKEWVRGWLDARAMEIRVGRSEGTDEEAFQERGIPTFRVSGRSRQSAHLPADRPDTIDKEKLGLMGQITLEAAILAAQASTTWLATR